MTYLTFFAEFQVAYGVAAPLFLSSAYAPTNRSKAAPYESNEEPHNQSRGVFLVLFRSGNGVFVYLCTSQRLGELAMEMVKLCIELPGS